MDGVVSRAYPGEFEARRFDNLQKYPQLSATSGADLCTGGQFIAATRDGPLPCPRPNQIRAGLFKSRVAGDRRHLFVRGSDPGVARSKGCTASDLRGRALVRLRLGPSGGAHCGD